MGINPTPTNHRSFTYDGKSTREFGVYITGEGVFNAPERAVEMISIPGRDGEYALDQGHFNNIEVTYRAGIVSYDTEDFAEAVSDFRNWLASRRGYCRLSDEYNPDEYRMAVFKNVISVEHEGLETGEFDITFNCKPQRWLTSGETAVAVTSGGTITNPTWFPSKPLVYAKGYGDINIGNRTITVSDEPIGEVLLANKIERNTSNRSYFDTATLALLNVGDTITVSSGSQLIVGISSSSTSTTITSITATVTGGTAQVIGAPSTYIDRYGDGRIEITMDAFDFANGTTENATVELDVTVNYKENGTTKSWSSTEFVAGYRYSVVYNAVSFAGFEVEPSLPDDIYSYIPRDATIENIYGYSTKQITADGYYIDLDIGEAYTMVYGVPSSINNLVTMPSDLPTLPPGDTEVTYDNTITKVEVQPNWWKV